MTAYRISPGGRLAGRLGVPGDKSISHRAVMLGAVAEGTSEIEGLLEGEDVLATVAAFRAMGVAMEGPAEGRLVIQGAGLHGLRPPAGDLDMGNSGTAMRLLCGLLAGQPFDSRLVGDASLSRRPMGRVAEPLRRMGAEIELAAGDRPPLAIRGGRRLRAIDYHLPVASAQVKSAVLLAGLYAEGCTRVQEPAPTRDHTERMLSGLGYPVERGENWTRLCGGGRLRGARLRVPGDISSAAFFLVGAAMVPGSEIVVEGLGVNPTRTGVLDILRAMGAEVEIRDVREAGGEPVADVHLRGGELQGIDIPEHWVPLAIDEFPAVLVAAAARGTTRLRGARELRVKESDRIAVMAEGLRALGVEVEETEDGAVVLGRGGFDGGTVDSHGDHRVAMAFAMAGLKSSAPVTVRDCRNVATSFPDFPARARAAGLRIEVLEDEG